MTCSEHLISFYRNLEPPQVLPDEIEWLYPQKDPAVIKIVEQFFHKFYNDTSERTIMLGINPGRHGAGITGVNFTGPRQLNDICGISHPFKPGSELSAEFIYDMIEAYGGVEKFYSRYFIGAVSPLGFVQKGKNLNYYDNRRLMETIEPFIIKNIERLLQMKYNRQTCLCIGGEKNYKYLARLNAVHHWFDNLIPLPHPRFIMQYRRKQKEQFIRQYLQFMT